jgi:carbon starvation protein
MLSPDGKPIPSYLAVWPVFGASNQLLAALSLIGLFMWIRNRKKGLLLQIVVGIPMLFMTVITLWALLININSWFSAIKSGARTIYDPIGLLSSILVILAIALITLSVRKQYKLRYS